MLKSIFCLFLLTECSSQLPGLRLSGKLCEGAKDLRVASLWPISNADRNEKLHVLFNFFEGLINRCLNMSIWQKVPFTLSPEHVVVCCEVQTALCQGSTAGRRSAGLLKGSLLVRCDLLNSCSSVTSHLVHWLGKKGVCVLCVFVLWGNGNHQVLLLPQIQHLCSAGPGSWQSCGHFLGDFPSQSSVEMSTLVAIGIILSEEQLHHKPPRQRTHSLLGRAQYWDYVVGFIKHSLHLPCQITLLTSHSACWSAARIFSLLFSCRRLLCL